MQQQTVNSRRLYLLAAHRNVIISDCGRDTACLSNVTVRDNMPWNSPEKETSQTCIFCLIANDQDREANVLKKNKELVCFRDIYPAAPHHYLVIPKQHITSCFSLHRGHIGLVKRMAEMGRAVLRDQGIKDPKDIRIGFHQPPCTSVDHLHLHVLAPISQISMPLEYKFIPGTYNFVTEEFLRKSLKDKAPPVNES